MLVEILPGEQELVRLATGTEPSPTFLKLFLAIRANMLRMGSSYEAPKELLALLIELANLLDGALSVQPANGHAPRAKRVIEPPKTPQPVVSEPAPVEDISAAEKDSIEKRYKSNGDALGSYSGQRQKWEVQFKSTPDTPIHKLEKGRPITYISPKDGIRRGGRFERMNVSDKRKANISSGEMKKVFAVPIVNIEVTDLSPPSTEPLPVQI